MVQVCDKQTNGMRTYVEKFASDSDVFYASFFPAFKKLMELGETDLTSPTEVCPLYALLVVAILPCYTNLRPRIALISGVVSCTLVMY